MNPIPPSINSVIAPPPRFDVRKITVCDKSTLRLSPNVSVALSNIPNSNCHSESLAFSISSNKRNDSFSLSVCEAANASCVISGCVSRCPRYQGGEPISLAISCESCLNRLGRETAGFRRGALESAIQHRRFDRTRQGLAPHRPAPRSSPAAHPQNGATRNSAVSCPIPSCGPIVLLLP